MSIECPSEAWDRYVTQHEEGCEVCNEHTDNCNCPECPKCGEVGAFECYEEHGLEPASKPEESPEELPCYRERDGGAGDKSWGCINDHTGCLWNDGHNTCNHSGESSSPLEEEA